MTIRELEVVDLPTARGPMRCMIFRPTGEGRHPGLVLYSEIFQITEPNELSRGFLILNEQRAEFFGYRPGQKAREFVAREALR